MKDIGLRVSEYSSMLAQLPVLLASLKDEDPGVARQAIVSGMKFFHSILQELVHQFRQHGKVERWAEEIWMHMIEFKAAVLSLVFEPISVGTRLLALKFLETCVLLFTPNAADTDRLSSGGKEHRFNVSWLASGHPVLDPAELISEAERLSTSLLDMLQSSNSIPGPLTITVVNCLASIARKRPEHYSHVLSAPLNFQSNSETRGGHAASLQYSVRSALLGFPRCTYPAICESRDRLVERLRKMNACDAADQVLRQVDKIMKNNERSSREARVAKEEKPPTQVPFSGDPVKRKLMPFDNEEPDNGLEMASKRMRHTSNGKSSDLVQIQESVDDNTLKDIFSEVPLVNNNVNPVEQVITVIAALLAEGERATDSLELLVSQIHPDLLADIVITNMKHLPNTAPLAKQGVPSSAQTVPVVSTVQGADSSSMPVHSSLSGQQGSISAAATVSTSLPDLSGSTNLQVDSRRDPRRATTGQRHGSSGGGMLSSTSGGAPRSFADVVRLPPTAPSSPAHAPQVPPTPHGLLLSANVTSPASASIFILSLTHQKTCEQIGFMKSELVNNFSNLRNFTVHFLKLERESINKTKRHFDPTMAPEDSAFYQTLIKFMPTFTHETPAAFWEHEWQTHGDQPIFTQREYFSNVCVLAEFFNLRDMLSAAAHRLGAETERIVNRYRGGKSSWFSLEAKTIVNAIAKHPHVGGRLPFLSCRKSDMHNDDRWYLFEVYFKFDYSLRHLQSYKDWTHQEVKPDDKIFFHC